MSTAQQTESSRGYDVFKGVVLALLAIAFILSLLRVSPAPEGNEAVSLANPAAEYCQDQGYTYEIRTAADGSQSGVCIFDDGSECDAWAYFNDECAPGGAQAAAEATEVAIVAPSLDSPAPGSELQPGETRFSGTGTPGSTVAIVSGAEQFAAAPVDENGRWEVPVVIEGDPGSLELTLQTLDGTGQVAAESAPLDFTVVDPFLRNLASNPLQADPLPQPAGGVLTVSGSAFPGADIAVDVDGQEAATTTSGDDGLWSVDIDAPGGGSVITARLLRPDGENASEIEVGTAAGAAAPLVLLPALALPPFNPLTGSITWTGESEPGTRVAALVDGVQTAETDTNEAGTWNLVVPIPEGAGDIAFAALDDNGDVIAAGDPLELPLPDSMPALTLPAFSLADEDLVFAGDTRSGSIDLGELDETDLPAITLPSGPYELSGSAAPGTQVVLLVDGEETAVGETAPDGTFALSTDLQPGEYSVQIALQTASGEQQAESLPLAVKVVDADPPVIDETGTVVEEDTLTVEGTAAPDAPLEITVDGEVVGETTAGTDGRWSFVLPSLPAVGAAVRARLLNDDGSLLVGSTPYTVPESVAEAATGEGETGTEGVAAETETGTEAEAEGEAVPGLSGTISGNVTYSERIALPDNAVVTVQLQDISRADASADILGEQVINTDGAQVPIPFAVTYDPAAILQNGRYNMAARIEDGDGNLLFINDTVTPVLNGDNPTDEVDIQTVKVNTAVSDVVLGEQTVDIPDDQTTPAGALEEAEGQFSVLLQGLQDSGRLDDLADSENEEGYTVFAPTDDAFAALPEAITANWAGNPDLYNNLLDNMIVEGRYPADELQDGQVLPTLGNDAGIVITREGDVIYANGVPIVESAEAGNSIVYALPHIILPPLADGVQPPVIDEEGVPTFVGPLLTVVGLGEPGEQILLTVDGQPFGEIATIDENQFWLVRQNVQSGIRYILAYMLDIDGRLQAISQEVVLPVP